MNNVTMIGRLARDPEIRATQEGLAIAKWSLAVDRRGKEQKADFFNCTAFGKTAEFAEHFLKKGTKIGIRGRLQNEEYTNKDGQKVTRTQIVVEEIDFCEAKRDAVPAVQEKKDEFLSIDQLNQEELPFNF